MPAREAAKRARRARTINAVLVGLTALAMILVVVLAIRTVEVEKAQREQAALTSEVLNELRDISRAALNGETGQRGYLISLDRRYLAPYFAGRDQLEPSLRRLRELVGGDASARQKSLLDTIDVLARAKFAEMEQGVALVGEGELTEARRLVLTDEGQETMERLRGALRELEMLELAELERARVDAATAEARVLPLLLGLLGLLAVSVVASGRLIARSARAEAEASQAQALADARDQANLLAKELNHRVKNLFAVVLAIVKLSARGAPEAKPVTDRIAERIMALLKAHEVSQGELAHPTVSLAALVEASLAPYRSPELTASLSGPEITLHARTITPLGLVLHELTTNAVKYGAWSQSGGIIAVDWRQEGDTIVLTWRETGRTIETQPTREGFGSMLIESSARQLGGSLERSFTPEGVVITIRFQADA